MAIWDHATEPIEVESGGHERLLGIQSEVDPSGDAATCSVAFTNQRPFKVHVPIGEIGLLISELRQAAGVMIARQRYKPDYGAAKLLELAESALHPTDIDVMVNPLTADRIFILQLEDGAPISLRMAPDEVNATIEKIARAAARAAN